MIYSQQYIANDIEMKKNVSKHYSLTSVVVIGRQEHSIELFSG